MAGTFYSYETDNSNKQVQNTNNTERLKMSQVLQDKRRKLRREKLWPVAVGTRRRAAVRESDVSLALARAVVLSAFERAGNVMSC